MLRQYFSGLYAGCSTGYSARNYHTGILIRRVMRGGMCLWDSTHTLRMHFWCSVGHSSWVGNRKSLTYLVYSHMWRFISPKSRSEKESVGQVFHAGFFLQSLEQMFCLVCKHAVALWKWTLVTWAYWCFTSFTSLLYSSTGACYVLFLNLQSVLE